MDKILQKIENKINSWIDNLEKKPIRTGVKTIILLWLLKWIYKTFIRDN